MLDRAEVITRVAGRDWSFSGESGGNGLFGLHPYPAKFIPQIPRALMQDIGVAEGGVVFDPFCGSGTTLIEAQALGYPSIGVDLNPIACLISEIATVSQPSELQDATRRCVQFAKRIKNPHIPDIPNLDHWFKKPIQKVIASILSAIKNEHSELTRDILRLALSSTIVRISNQDSDTRYAAVAKSVSSSYVFESFGKVCNRYAHTLPSHDSSLPECEVYCKDILDIVHTDIQKPVGLVVCSPPYPNAYEYWLYHKYRLWWLGYDPLFVKDREIGARPHYFKRNSQTPDDFRQQMQKVFELLKAVCIDNSYACFVLGDSKIHGKIINNTELLCHAASACNFEPVAILGRNISLTRKAFNLTNSRLKTENIIIFQKRRYRPKPPACLAKLYWHTYRYFPYEKRFAFRELMTLPGVRRLEVGPDTVSVSLTRNGIKKLKKLVYFSEYKVSTGENGRTLQSILENGLARNGIQKRQSTRYGVHGLHEYKGKFNPQIVRGILNSYCLKQTAKILDPFCGSGTTLVESSIAGFRSIGWDMNPFAVYLSNAKVAALHCNLRKIRSLSSKILNLYDNGYSDKIELDLPRIEYLQCWFSSEVFTTIEKFRVIIESKGGNLASFFLVILSNLLREYSLQEPSDLRIRRRISPMPKISLRDRLELELAKKIKVLQISYSAYGPVHVTAKAIVADGRSWQSINAAGYNKNSFDFALTSPPYAMALPYIDTQRLSLIWLGLLNPKAIRATEEEMIGSREAKQSELLALVDNLSRNEAGLPNETLNYCKLLQTQIDKRDGFRRRAVPALLYRYFSDMMLTFKTVRGFMKSGGFYAMIVGTNRTTLGGTQFYIDTPKFLAELATHQGWSIVELLPLDSYKRFGLHSANAVKNETLVVLKNE